MSEVVLSSETVTILPRREQMALVKLSFGSIVVNPQINVAAGASVANAIQVLANNSVNNAFARFGVSQ